MLGQRGGIGGAIGSGGGSRGQRLQTTFQGDQQIYVLTYVKENITGRRRGRMAGPKFRQRAFQEEGGRQGGT